MAYKHKRINPVRTVLADIPIPRKRHGGGSWNRPRYPWLQLKVGGRAMVIQHMEPTEKNIASVRTSGAAFSRKRGNTMKFIVRKVSYEGSEVIAVWRIE